MFHLLSSGMSQREAEKILERINLALAYQQTRIFKNVFTQRIKGFILFVG